jgi:GST-like protein
MSELLLYDFGNSVCCQKVRITLRAKGLEWRAIGVDLFKAEQYDPKYLKLNPKGVVPTLVHDGKPVIESTLICEYIDGAFPQPPRLIPADPWAQSRMRLWSKMVDEGLFEGVTEISFSAMFRERMKNMPEEIRQARFRNVGDPRRTDRFKSTYEQERRLTIFPKASNQNRTNTVIDLYTWTTPNGRKASIALEEFGLPYTVHAVDISKDEQFKPDFLKISPNNRIPAIVDRDNGLSLMESGAILIYLADKTGKLLPKSGDARYHTIEWLMWQMGGPGPMLGQVHHFVKYNPGKAPYAEERYLKEAHRLYGVLDKQLADHEYVAGDYSIADIAIWPWISRYEWQTVDMNKYPNVKRWYLAIAKRPATQKGYKVPKDVGEIPMP